MLLEYIERMREKPRAARRRFAFMVATGATSFIALLWMFTLPAKFSSLSIETPLKEQGSDDVAALGAAVDSANNGLQELINMGELMPNGDPYIDGAQQEPAQEGPSPDDGGSLQPFSISETADAKPQAQAPDIAPPTAPERTPTPSAHSEEIVF